MSHMNLWNDQIDKLTNDFLQTFGHLTVEQLNWKPSAKAWSIAQNIDHIITINATYFPILEGLKNGTYKTPWISRVGFMVSFFGNAILKAVQPDRKKKVKTIPIWEPDKSLIPIGILKTYEAHQNQLKDMIRNSKELIQKGVVISSPANKNIVYKLDKAFEIIITHEKRHFEQSKDVLQLMNLKANEDH